jgi:hypothetical protein
MIFTSYFAKVKKFSPNITPIAICIKPPEGYKGLWYPELAPDYDILKRWKRDRNEEDYVKLFTRSVLDNLSIDTVLKDIDELLPMRVQQSMAFPYAIEKDSNYHVALLCYEKSGDFCHRHLVADWFRRNGVECKEWEENNGSKV